MELTNQQIVNTLLGYKKAVRWGNMSLNGSYLSEGTVLKCHARKYGYVGNRYVRIPIEYFEITLVSDVSFGTSSITEEGITISKHQLAYGYTTTPAELGRTDFSAFISWEDFFKDVEARERLLKAAKKHRVDVTVTKDGGVISFKRGDNPEILKCNLADNTFSKVYKTGTERVIKYPNSFFRYLHGQEIIAVMKDIDNGVFAKFLETVAYINDRCSNFGTFLIRMFDFKHLESYVAAGAKFDNNIICEYTDFDKDMRRKMLETNTLYKNSVATLFTSNLDLGRAIFSRIKDKENFTEYVEGLSSQIQGLNTLVTYYGYDLNTLFNYIDARQGDSDYRMFGCIGELSDYARMSEDIYGEGNFVKYPNDLKEEHDLITVLHRKRSISEETKKSFKECIKPELEWKDKKFAVIYPKEVEELLDEGKALKHCVGSYHSHVTSGKCDIVFLRDLADIRTPLVTLEIRQHCIQQAKGYGNKAPKYEASLAIKDYAKSKKLIFDI